MYEIMNDLLKYIEDHLYEDISLEKLSDFSNYSKSYLSREFNKIIGLSIPDYVTKRRLSNAAIMIFETDKKISYIADIHGFNSDKYFSTLFKKNFGISPRTYRNKPKYIYLYPKRQIEGGEHKKMEKLEDIICEVKVDSNDEKEISVTISNIEVKGKEINADVEVQDDGTVKITIGE